MDLDRVWPNLPYMGFIRSRPMRGSGDNMRHKTAPTQIHHASFHTHIALSPVVTRLIREEYTLPVRELRLSDEARERLTQQAPIETRVPAHAGQDVPSRLINLIQTVERERPAVVRGVTPGSLDLRRDGNTDSNSDRDANYSSTESRQNVDAGMFTYSKPSKDVLETIAKDNGLDSSSIASISEKYFGDGENQPLPDAILPPEFQEYLKLDAEPPAGKRYVGKRSRHDANQSESQDSFAAPSSMSKSGNPSGLRAAQRSLPVDNPLEYSEGRSNVHQRSAAETVHKNKGAGGLAVLSRERPNVERETETSRDTEQIAPSPAAEAAIVQDTVRKTLRTLPEPDVEAFAVRVSKSIERRMQIDRDWRGDL